MNVLSLFDGISVGQLALQHRGISVDNYYASEINPYAITITQHNFPNTVQLGDINNWKAWSIDWASINLVLAGSPCQDLSFAGKKDGLSGSRSSLFYVFRDILKHIQSVNPSVLFLLENVKMKGEYLDIITNEVGVEPVRINSNLMSAQNRDRYYWTNIADGNIPLPEDMGIVLKDILLPEYDGKYPLSGVYGQCSAISA